MLSTYTQCNDICRIVFVLTIIIVGLLILFWRLFNVEGENRSTSLFFASRDLTIASFFFFETGGK